MASFDANTIYELDASTNELSPRFMVYRLYGDQTISPYINLGLFSILTEANLAASKMCSSEFGYMYNEQDLANGLVAYKRLGAENRGPDDIVTIFTGLRSIPILATVNPVTPNTTCTAYGPIPTPPARAWRTSPVIFRLR
jgi:hypothetical protein